MTIYNIEYNKVKIEKVIDCFSKNCPDAINHHNPYHDLEMINKVGSEACQKCDYFLCIKDDYVCCSSEIV